MELNALTRWNSIGASLFDLSQLDAAIHNLLRQPYNDVEQSNTIMSSMDHSAPTESDSKVDDGHDKFSFRIRLLLLAKRGIRRFLKGFAVGAGGQGVFSTAKLILKRHKQKTKLTSPSHVILPDVKRFGVFVGLFLALFECGMLLPDVFEHSSNYSTSISSSIIESSFRAWLPAISGGFAGLALLVAPVNIRLTVSLFFTVRAFESLCRLSVKYSFIPDVPHADAALMSVASAQVLWAWFYFPHTLDAGYRKFLDYQGGNQPLNKAAYAEWTAGQNISPYTLSTVNSWRVTERMPLLVSSAAQNGCEIIHPHTSSCSLATLQFFVASLRRALPIYVPVYVLPFLIFKSSKILADPVNIGKLLLIGVMRSSTFLASYCSMAWWVSCQYRPKSEGGRTHLLAALSGFFAGTCVLVEKKSRRIELALFVMSHALQSSYRILRARRVVGIVPFGEVALFCAASSIIMHCFQREPSAMRPSYNSLLQW